MAKEEAEHIVGSARRTGAGCSDQEARGVRPALGIVGAGDVERSAAHVNDRSPIDQEWDGSTLVDGPHDVDVVEVFVIAERRESAEARAIVGHDLESGLELAEVVGDVAGHHEEIEAHDFRARQCGFDILSAERHTEMEVAELENSQPFEVRMEIRKSHGHAWKTLG